jgi:phage gp36-like protein
MWLHLTPDDTARLLTAAEQRTLSTVQLPAGMTWDDLVCETQRDVTAMVRSHCGVRYTLGPPDTIPSELRAAAVDILRYRALSRLPLSDSLITPAREQQYRDALQCLRDASAGRLALEPPDSTDTPPAAPVQTTTHAGSTYTPGRPRPHLSGLL